MNHESYKKTVVRGVVIGEGKPSICLPLVAGNEEKLMTQASQLTELDPDLLEWRIDCYEHLADEERCLSTLKALRELIGEIPLIFTCRSSLEGGECELSPAKRLHLITSAIVSGYVDVVDVEMSSGREVVAQVAAEAQKAGCKLILSYHNFTQTPPEQFIVDKLVQAEEMGADIAKLAVMPENSADVLTLLAATNTARTCRVQIPIVTMSMGEVGGVTRVAGGLFGSAITFAVGDTSSAPGQLPIEDVRLVLDVLY